YGGRVIGKARRNRYIVAIFDKMRRRRQHIRAHARLNIEDMRARCKFILIDDQFAAGLAVKELKRRFRYNIPVKRLPDEYLFFAQASAPIPLMPAIAAEDGL